MVNKEEEKCDCRDYPNHFCISCFNKLKKKIIEETGNKELEFLNKGKFYDKMSKEELSLKIVLGRIEVGLNNTFYIIFNSEDCLDKIKLLDIKK